MSYSPSDAAIVGSVTSSINTASTALANSGLNRKTIKYNKEMYDKQRADALSDWTMQNEYNSPRAQMARLREAGLNPNLVYGKGADNTAQAVRSSDTKSFSPIASDFSNMGGNFFGDMYDFAMKQAQTDNLMVMNTVNAQEAILKAAQTANVASQTAKSNFDLKQAEALSTYSVQAAKEGVRKLQADIDYTLNQDQRAAVSNAQSIKESLARMLNLESQRANDKATREKINQEIENLKTDNEIKALDKELKALGIQPTDNMFFRILGRKWQELKQSLPRVGLRPGDVIFKFPWE